MIVQTTLYLCVTVKPMTIRVVWWATTANQEGLFIYCWRFYVERFPQWGSASCLIRSFISQQQVICIFIIIKYKLQHLFKSPSSDTPTARLLWSSPMSPPGALQQFGDPGPETSNCVDFLLSVVFCFTCWKNSTTCVMTAGRPWCTQLKVQCVMLARVLISMLVCECDRDL